MTRTLFATLFLLVSSLSFAAGWQGAGLSAVSSSRIVQVWGFKFVKAETNSPGGKTHAYLNGQLDALFVMTEQNRISSSQVFITEGSNNFQNPELLFGSHYISASGIRFDSSEVETFIAWAKSAVKSRKGSKTWRGLKVSIVFDSEGVKQTIQ